MQQIELGRRLRSGSKTVTEPDSDVGERAADDWLADVGELNWLDTAEDRSERSGGANERAFRPRPDPLRSADDLEEGPQPATGRLDPDFPASAGHPGPAAVRRRRTVAALVLFALLGSAIAVPLVLLRSGQNTTGVQPATSAAESTAAPTTSTPAPTPATSPLTVQLPAGGKLRLGDVNHDTVSQLQKALASLGFGPGKADGIFGPATRAAVIEFQRSKGLDPDGIVGKNTAGALNKALAEQTRASG